MTGTPEPLDALVEGAMAYEDALDALSNPMEILAHALQHVAEASDLHRRLSGGYVPADADRLTAQQRSALDVAAALASIAQAVVAVREGEGLPHTDPDFHGWADDGSELGRDDGPHAQAARFRADFEAGDVGRIGGRHFVFEPGIGWVDVTDGNRSDVDGQPGRMRVLLTGRAVSTYNDQVLVITDGGVGMTLPMSLVTLEADE